jgi:23S rRNA-/tRNA-specific pseudouridylate synthase
VRSGGKPSFLDVTLVAAVPGIPDESHFLVRLQTGRFHQIRVMLAHRGAPLSGDSRYGGPAQRRFYLEHTILGARMFQTLEWRVWQAPNHTDRPRWSPTLTDAVNAQVRTLSTTLAEAQSNVGDVMP